MAASRPRHLPLDGHSLNPPLITFAVRSEAQPAQRLLRRHNISAAVLITGIGPVAASHAISASLATARPRYVLTCGFAGALCPDLTLGTLVASADPAFPAHDALTAAGARFVPLTHSARILTTSCEKRALRTQSRADAVDMESTAIREICLRNRIPSATLRVISDTATEELPLDFNRFLSGSGQMHYLPLLLALVQAPRLIPKLIRFQHQTRHAAETLGRALQTILSGF